MLKTRHLDCVALGLSSINSGLICAYLRPSFLHTYVSFNLTMAESSTMSLYVGQEWDDKYETRQAITNWLANKGESLSRITTL